MNSRPALRPSRKSRPHKFACAAGAALAAQDKRNTTKHDNMKYSTLMSCLIIAALIIPLASLAGFSLPSLRTIQRACGFHTGHAHLNALGDGESPNGIITRLADAALTTRHLLVKVGSDGSHFAVCTADDLPLGVCRDEPDAAEYPAAIKVPGCYDKTLIVVASEAIAVDDDIYTDEGGKVQDEPAVAGTFYKIGKALTAASGDGIELEIAHHAPIKVVVIAALTSTNGTAAGAADLAALKTEAEKIGDDVRAIGTALATPALVKVLV